MGGFAKINLGLPFKDVRSAMPRDSSKCMIDRMVLMFIWMRAVLDILILSRLFVTDDYVYVWTRKESNSISICHV